MVTVMLDKASLTLCNCDRSAFLWVCKRLMDVAGVLRQLVPRPRHPSHFKVAVLARAHYCFPAPSYHLHQPGTCIGNSTCSLFISDAGGAPPSAPTGMYAPFFTCDYKLIQPDMNGCSLGRQDTKSNLAKLRLTPAELVRAPQEWLRCS